VLAWRAVRAGRLEGRRAGVIGLWVASPYLLLMWLQGPHFLGFVLMYALTGEAGGYVWAAPSIVLGVVVSLALAWKLATQRRRS
jgi:hypothetical protein